MSRKSISSFEEQLDLGHHGESICRKALNGIPSITLDFDFALPDGRKVELKTETHAPNNVFVELYGNWDRRSIGGPFRAVRDGVQVYAHFFIHYGLLLIFNSAEIVAFLNARKRQYRSHVEENRGWRSLGIIVPVIDVLHLAREVHCISPEGILENSSL